MMDGYGDGSGEGLYAGTEGRRSDRIDLDQFCDVVARSLGTTTRQLQASGSLVGDFRLDELSLADLVMTIQDLNPYFHIPDQMDVRQITLPDLYHYYCVMDKGHFEQEDN